MDYKFKQSHFFDRRTFIIKENGVEATTSGLNNSSTVFLKFEQIGFIKSTIMKGNKFLLIGAVLSFLFTLVIIAKSDNTVKPGIGFYLFYPTIGTVCLSMYFIKSKTYFILTSFDNTGKMVFLTNPDNDSKLKDFLVQLKSVRDRYLLENYGVINKNLP